ncbi:hypothetical protein N752_24055 [Desulforamulus aquiferis]|nr:hypothetical protein N752_24055 [Desulforamulus aquiferis]
MTRVRLNTPLNMEVVNNLRIGQQVLINGVIYTGRDAAHKKLVDLLDREKIYRWTLTDR